MVAVPTLSDTAICIRQWDFSETSQTVQLFTREHGMLRGLAKGARRQRGSFSGGFDVLTRGVVAAIVKPGRDLATITDWQLQETYRAIRRDLGANRAGLYMADLVYHMLRDADPHTRLFDAFALCLEMLATPGGARGALLRAQWAVLSETGYRLELHRDVVTGSPLSLEEPTFALHPLAGGFVADAPDERFRVRRETVELLRAVASGEVIEVTVPETVDRANRLLAVCCREILGRELPTMRWTFGDLV
jgi:DNA repair protein RecO (recombination protein O)